MPTYYYYDHITVLLIIYFMPKFPQKASRLFKFLKSFILPSKFVAQT